MTAAIENELTEIWGDNPVLKTKIPMNLDVLNSANLFAPVTAVNEYMPAVKALKKLTREVVEKID